MDTIKGGFILDPRCLDESDIKRSPPHVREVWRYLCKNANYEDSSYGGFNIKRGQTFRSYKEIKEFLSWNIGWKEESYSDIQIKNSIRFLKDTGRITTEKKPRGVIFTIVKYDFYQNAENYKKTSEIPAQENTDTITMQESDNNGIEEKEVKPKSKRETIKKEKEQKNRYGERKDVLLYLEEHNKLIEQFGENETSEKIENLSLYIGSTGKKYVSHYLTIIGWERKNNKQNKQQSRTLEIKYE